jgi:hypothetical protein
MKNEMELMNMDERQRLAWFMANRGTVIAVGAVWIGMIAWELTHGRVPAFLMIMVPFFALLRAGLYFFYSSRPFSGGEPARDSGFVRYGKIAAALVLLASVFLPLDSIAGARGEAGQYRYVWGLIKDNNIALLFLSLVYLWPLPVFVLTRMKTRRILQLVVQFAEPLLAVTSCILLLWIPQLIFETRSLFFIPVLVDPKPEWGCYLAVAGNGLYIISWLAGFLQPWGVQDG